VVRPTAAFVNELEPVGGDVIDQLVRLSRDRLQQETGIDPGFTPDERREVRERLLLSQRDIAAAIGCSATTVGNYETSAGPLHGDYAERYIAVIRGLAGAAGPPEEPAT
jgi:DNA-binding transcriptional regulator YiaG